MRSVRKKRRSLKSTLLYLMIIVLLSVLAFSYTSLNRYLQNKMTSFKLEDIEVSGNFILAKTDVLQLCGLEEGKQLLTVKPVEVVGALSKSPYIKAVSAVRSLPSRLRIVIRERRPVAFIQGKGLNLIDEDGYLMPVPVSNQRWDLPFISHPGEPLGEPGKRTISGRAMKIVEMINYLDYMRSPVRDLIAEIRLDKKNHLQLRLVRGGAKVFIEPDTYQENLFVLSEYIKTYQDWDKLSRIEYMDIRFKDQLIIKEHEG